MESGPTRSPPEPGPRAVSRFVSAAHVAYLLLSPLPLLGLLALRAWAGSLEGWGSWAAAAAVGPWLVIVSGALGLLGLGIAWWRRRRGLPVAATLLAAALSGSVAAWALLVAL